MIRKAKEAGDKVRSSKVAKQNKKLGHDLAKKAEDKAVSDAKKKLRKQEKRKMLWDKARTKTGKAKDPNRFKIKSRA